MENAKDQINKAYQAIADYPFDDHLRARAKEHAKRALEAYMARDTTAVLSALAQLHANLPGLRG